MTRILVVDDDEDNIKLFTIILEHVGFKVYSYSDPIEALKEFKASYYDLVILDYLMPGMNGLELYKILRQSDESIKALILTASREQLFSSHNEEFRDAVLKIVGKPILIQKLLDEIDSILCCVKKTNIVA
ncbi:MAG: response regulator [Nitrososphaerales archaeon]